MAGLGRRTFAPGEVLTASNVMNYLQDQVVQNYAGTAARGSAIGSAVSQGMVSYLDDSNSLEVYKTTGTAVAGWEPVNLAQSPNYIINGAFDIWQRGTSFSNVASVTYTADRWWVGKDATATLNVSRQAITPGTQSIMGFEAEFNLRFDVSAWSSSPVYLTTRLEDVRTLSGQTVTLSYWAKSSVAVTSTPLYSQNFGSGGSSVVAASVGSSASITTSWQKFTHTFVLPSVSGKTIGANSFLDMQVLRFSQAATIDIEGVQLEAGQTATPFRRNANSLQGELAACQRYYFRTTGAATDARLATGIQPNTSSASIVLQLPTTMRIVPTSMEYANLFWTDSVGFNQALSSLGFNWDGGSRTTVNLGATFSAIGAARYPGFISCSAAGGFIGVSAEL
jgi:hypothetical protein